MKNQSTTKEFEEIAKLKEENTKLQNELDDSKRKIITLQQQIDITPVSAIANLYREFVDRDTTHKEEIDSLKITIKNEYEEDITDLEEEITDLKRQVQMYKCQSDNFLMLSKSHENELIVLKKLRYMRINNIEKLTDEDIIIFNK